MKVEEAINLWLSGRSKSTTAGDGGLHNVSIEAGAGVQMRTHHDTAVRRRHHQMVTVKLQ